MACGDRRFHAAVQFPDQSVRKFQVVASNISRGGVAIVHDKPISAGTDCSLLLPLTTGEVMGVRGAVRHSRNMALMLHEIGVQFEAPLTPDEFELIALVESR
jgi:hypothetical protein